MGTTQTCRMHPAAELSMRAEWKGPRMRPKDAVASVDMLRDYWLAEGGFDLRPYPEDGDFRFNAQARDGFNSTIFTPSPGECYAQALLFLYVWRELRKKAAAEASESGAFDPRVEMT